MSDLVSILIPTYNRASVIERTVRSALAQTYPNIEVVVVDNASTDGTWERLQQFASDDARVRISRNETNLGPVANWLACAAAAQGRYAKILWSDDMIAPTFVERCLPFLRDEGVAFAYSATLVFSGETPQEGGVEMYRAYGPGDVVIGSREFIDGVMTDGDYPVSPGCALFRTEDLRRNLWLQVPNRHGSDFSMHAIGNDLLLFLLTAGQRKSVAVIGEILSFFRSHNQSISVIAGMGRVIYHYDLAKAYFCAEVLKDRRVERRLNARIFLHLRRFGLAPYGIKRVEDFYPQPRFEGVDWPHFVKAVVAGMSRKLMRAVKRS